MQRKNVELKFKSITFYKSDAGIHSFYVLAEKDGKFAKFLLRKPLLRLISFNSVNTPFKIILSSGKSNSEKISNEDSSLNTYKADNEISLNRYSGTDKMDMLITTVQEGNANMVRAVQGSGVG